MMSSRSHRMCFYLQVVTAIILATSVYFLWCKMLHQQSVIERFELKLTSPSVQSELPVITQHLNSQNSQDKISLTKLPSMYDIGLATGTDKVYHHGYHRYYPTFLENFRSTPDFNMLEIGYLLGQSYQMWIKYFPLGKVYFMDKDCGQTLLEARFCGDQGKVSDLQALLKTKGVERNLDFIIDDGSHHPAHQITSFKYLFEHGLKPGGIYIIEDIEMNYWQKGDTYGLTVNYGKDHPDSLITHLKALADVVNREFTTSSRPFTSPFGAAIDSSVSSVFFGHNCVVILKMTTEEKKIYGSREYRYMEHFNP